MSCQVHYSLSSLTFAYQEYHSALVGEKLEEEYNEHKKLPVSAVIGK